MSCTHNQQCGAGVWQLLCVLIDPLPVSAAMPPGSPSAASLSSSMASAKPSCSGVCSRAALCRPRFPRSTHAVCRRAFATALTRPAKRWRLRPRARARASAAAPRRSNRRSKTRPDEMKPSWSLCSANASSPSCVPSGRLWKLHAACRLRAGSLTVVPPPPRPRHKLPPARCRLGLRLALPPHALPPHALPPHALPPGHRLCRATTTPRQPYPLQRQLRGLHAAAPAATQVMRPIDEPSRKAGGLLHRWTSATSSELGAASCKSRFAQERQQGNSENLHDCGCNTQATFHQSVWQVQQSQRRARNNKQPKRSRALPVGHVCCIRRRFDNATVARLCASPAKLGRCPPER